MLMVLWLTLFPSVFVGEHCLFKLAMPSSLGPSSVAAALQEALENSARLIDRHLQEDRCFPDLSELLNLPSHSKSPLGIVHYIHYSHGFRCELSGPEPTGLFNLVNASILY